MSLLPRNCGILNIDRKVVEGALDDCLMELGLDYLDLYLVHFPVAFKKSDQGVGENLFPRASEDGEVVIDDDVSIVDTWKGIYCLFK